jgi:hypothetical protein
VEPFNSVLLFAYRLLRCIAQHFLPEARTIISMLRPTRVSESSDTGIMSVHRVGKHVVCGAERCAHHVGQRALRTCFQAAAGIAKFSRAHAANFVGCRPATLLASVIASRESVPR